MTRESAFETTPGYRSASRALYRGVPLATHYGDAAAEYQAAAHDAALFDRSDRGRILVTGRDRKSWLHGLVTNAVATLDDDSGNYAFVLDARGRTLFDLNILSMPGALWLDVDGLMLTSALTHLDRYLFAEDARLTDVSAQDARLAVSGPLAGRVAGALGVTNFAALPALAHRRIDDGSTVLLRHDLAGDPAFELFVPRDRAAAWWERLVELGARPAGRRALDVRRIEAGIPWLGRDIDELVRPPETGQTERGISYLKGCFVGYEILERMRSRGALARELVRVTVADGAAAEEHQPVYHGDAEVGRLTSLAQRPTDGAWLGLGYLSTTLTDRRNLRVGQTTCTATSLP